MLALSVNSWHELRARVAARYTAARGTAPAGGADVEMEEAMMAIR